MRGSWIPLLLAAELLPAARAGLKLFVLENGNEQSAPAIYDVGAVAPGDVATTRFVVRNDSNTAAVLNYLEIRGVGFGPRYPLALPVALDPQGAVNFSVTFSAPDTGGYSAALVSEGISVILTATTKLEIPWPAPRLTIDLPRAQSAQQGSALVKFDAPAPRGGKGTLSLDFQPAEAGTADVAIAFASGGRTVEFTFARADAQGRFGSDSMALFQTGTTAGRLTLTAQVDSSSDQAGVTIAPEPVAVNAVQGRRSADNLDIQVTGYDNTRTAGPLTFTFFDAAGLALAPGMIRTDASTQFRQFYETSELGGMFALRAVFPVTGDAGQIAAVEVSLTNTAGAAITARTQF